MEGAYIDAEAWGCKSDVNSVWRADIVINVREECGLRGTDICCE
jgi:hypothetical protein